MTVNEKRALVEGTKIVTLNGNPAKLLGWELDKAQVVCFPPMRNTEMPEPPKAEFSWDFAAYIIAENDGEFSSKDAI